MIRRHLDSIYNWGCTQIAEPRAKFCRLAVVPGSNFVGRLQLPSSPPPPLIGWRWGRQTYGLSMPSGLAWPPLLPSSGLHAGTEMGHHRDRNGPLLSCCPLTRPHCPLSKHSPAPPGPALLSLHGARTPLPLCPNRATLSPPPPHSPTPPAMAQPHCLPAPPWLCSHCYGPARLSPRPLPQLWSPTYHGMGIASLGCYGCREEKAGLYLSPSTWAVGLRGCMMAALLPNWQPEPGAAAIMAAQVGEKRKTFYFYMEFCFSPDFLQGLFFPRTSLIFAENACFCICCENHKITILVHPYL